MSTLFRDKVVANLVTFNDSLALPVAGAIELGMDVLDGWGGTPELIAEFTSLGMVDGETPSEYFAARGRQLTAGGWGMASSRAAAEMLWDAIMRDAFPRNVAINLERYETIPKRVTALRNGPGEISWIGPTQFRWGVPLRCYDPFKYALTPTVESAGVAGQATGGRTYPRTYPLEYTTVSSGEANLVVFNNDGTGQSKNMVVSINGPLAKGAWRLVNETTGGLIKFDVALLVTDQLVIDFYNEVATLNGSLITVTMTGDFWRAAQGPNVIKLYGDYDPLVSFTLTAYSAWEN